jgi:hypothetical protein
LVFLCALNTQPGVSLDDIYIYVLNDEIPDENLKCGTVPQVI